MITYQLSLILEEECCTPTVIHKGYLGELHHAEDLCRVQIEDTANNVKK